MRLATTKTSTFPARVDRASRTRPTYAIGNHNRLLWNYPGTIGVKNGFTKAAHRTFIGAARRNGRTYLVTEMYGTGSSWRPAASLLDWAFAHGDEVRPIGRLVERGEVPVPPAPPAPATARKETARGANPRDDSVVAAFTPHAPKGAMTPSLIPIAGGAALVGLLLVTRSHRLRAGRVRRERAHRGPEGRHRD